MLRYLVFVSVVADTAGFRVKLKEGLQRRPTQASCHFPRLFRLLGSCPVRRMGDHFVLMVDRLLTESTLEAITRSRNHLLVDRRNAESLDDAGAPEKKNCCDAKVAECRICHDEDEGCNMESPCSCSGSLKYAHRKCVQRWCDEKGDIMCEICLQQFVPGYDSPPKRFHCGNVREIFQDADFAATVASDRGFSDTFYDNHGVLSQRSVMYCRFVAVLFMVLLVLRHVLPLVISDDEGYTLTTFTVLLLRTFGILSPVYVIAYAVHKLRSRHQQQLRTHVIPAANSESDEELSDSSPSQHQTHVVRVF